jgi:trans-aconitate 2-methyltransferase
VNDRPAYAFGDSALARERLGIVAATFEAPTRAFLAALPAIEPRYVLDLGCGPGYTTALLGAVYPRAHVTGLDASAAMVTEAAERVENAAFAVADVTETLQLPADVAYARLLLGHLPDPAAALATWVRALRPPGLLACEEPVRYTSDLELFERYETAVTTVVAARGASLWAGLALDDDPVGCTRVVDRVVEHPVSAARAAAMFWRNATTWRAEHARADALIDELRAIEAAGAEDVVMWQIRQTAWIKSPG